MSGTEGATWAGIGDREGGGYQSVVGGPPGCMGDGVWEILCREKPGMTPKATGTQEKMGGEGESARFVWD